MNSIFSETNVTFGRLQAFADVVKAGSIVAATGKNPTKQSQYSRHIKELEDGLKMRLFNRNKGVMTPSFNGQQLAGIVSAFANALQDLVDEQTTANRLIRIGAGNSVYQWMLLPIAKQLQTQLPNVSLEFYNLRSRAIIEKLRQGEIDIGIARNQESPSTDHLESKSVRSLRFALYYKKEAFEKPTIKKLLSSGRVIGLSGDGSIWQKTKALMEKHDQEPRLWMRFDSMPMVSNALKQTEAVAILPLKAQEELAPFGYDLLHHQDLDTFQRNYTLQFNTRIAQMRSPIKKAAEKFAQMLA